MKHYTSRQLIDKLVSFETLSSDSNLPLIQFVQSYLAEYGVNCKLVPSDDGEKANLYATVGPMVEGGVVVSGHTDVVPVEGQPWDSNPFQVTEKNGRLYGRGTADMKSFLAVALALVPEMLEKDLRKPIHFALSYDEEIGCFGAPSMINEMAEMLPHPMAVIVGEPTSMRIINAHKGIGSYTTTVTGHEAHSSQIERGVSAVMIAARLVTFLEDMMFENQRNVSSDSPFEPPYTSVHVGKINGGTAVNIIARECSFDWDVRTIPGEIAQDYVDRLHAHCEVTIKKMRRISPACNIVTTVNAEAPGMRPEENGAAELLCKQLIDEDSTEVVSYATEGGLFQDVNFSTVICGPGSINQAHKPNEYIEISQVQAAELFMHKLIDHLARSGR
ncbi:MAG TPA: acetylornithine deacetylase [Desulfobacterales bacterium]|nr:acetylornithine deacetylase [Desulfobacterales bacterium]